MKTISIFIFLAVMLVLKIPPCFAKEVPVLPYPQHVEAGQKVITLPVPVALTGTGIDRPSMDRLSAHWQNFIREAKPQTTSAVTVRIGIIGKDQGLDSLVQLHGASWLEKIGREGYLLLADAGQPVIAANTETGLFYGLQTLKQLLRGGWNTSVFIADWPAFDHRVIYDDISRGPISTVAYIKKQIERMAEIKINYLSFYIEHVVQPLSHPDFAPADGKLTIAEIKELSAYAEKYHMQLIGSFQSFGHFEKILSLPQYKSIGETSTLISPLDPKAKAFLSSVIGELCDAFNAPFFNVNCDETFDLVKGRSKAYVDSVGAARFYADHIKYLYDIVKQHGKKMMMWGDFVVEHEEVLDMLPKDIIYLTWEYGDKSSYDHWIAPFAKRNLEYMVCPGILNSYRLFPDMLMAKPNIINFIKEGKQKGASGVITTVWDDGGASFFSGDWYGVYLAAEKSWHTDDDNTASFDHRYELNAYGSDNGNYVQALFKLMQLRNQPLTYELSDQLWYQQLLPESGKRLILNNSDADTVMHILEEAGRLSAAARPLRNREDLLALQFGIDQYKLIINSRKKVAEMATAYARAAALVSTDRKAAAKLLQQSGQQAGELGNDYKALRKRFRAGWLLEDQHYWLDTALMVYDRKIADLQQLQSELGKAAGSVAAQQPLPAAAAIRLDVTESNHTYFRNWLLSGPFPAAGKGFPEFLYSANAAYNKPPIPGDIMQYAGKSYRWKKVFSNTGGIMDLDTYFNPPQDAVVYGYCSVSTDEPLTVNAYLDSSDSTILYCNGVQCDPAAVTGSDSGKEVTVRLDLRPGVNHILLKTKKGTALNCEYTFRLQEDLTVTNHKHKYQLNSKHQIHEAE